ncbi:MULTISPECIES: transcriptional regulator, SarA/Rot family [Bradyrhizobium]|uniref:MarR family transcriptional regulator n=1 Tax=Bradyrhizobium arachidis TaxID=858423 RepID=A0AAE7NIA7_9BRAD|nr:MULTISPECIES: MarR family transcriptional regulator [Bradyrhizobium]MDA9445728.1 MarR family transcriptional regulator [Bradyrhizobium sp. CCBAU 21360]QOZ11919.1 MarR family transcriptional regulator [Bradyrhizobium sp. CCBAU 51765]QOZ66509.1 MarR family transcriptional regulator [Bradyrhizobium arachidis]SFV19894.1 DNA-binding transcriptional regulator, MarR family [Bradyrhizobium arachidis]
MPSKLTGLKRRLGKSLAASQDVLRRFTWEIRAINVCLDDLRSFQAHALGIAAPQMMILMALIDLEHGDGVPVNVVAKLMKVESAFITKHSKQLEDKRFVRRERCANDARIVHLSLTDSARRGLASIAAQQEELDEFVSGYLDIAEFAKLASCLSGVRQRLEKARLHAALKMQEPSREQQLRDA